VSKTLLSIDDGKLQYVRIYTYRYVRLQNVAQAHNYVKWAGFSPNYLGVVQPMVTAQKMNCI